MIFDKELFAKAIRVHRAELRLTMEQVAKQVGICTASMYRLSNTLDPGMPDVESFHKIITWMNANHSDFFVHKSELA